MRFWRMRAEDWQTFFLEFPGAEAWLVEKELRRELEKLEGPDGNRWPLRVEEQERMTELQAWRKTSDRRL